MKTNIFFIATTCIAMTLTSCGVLEILDKSSVREFEDGLYYLEYNGDYGFESFVAQGGAATDAQMADYIKNFLTGKNKKKTKKDHIEIKAGCSVISAKNSEGHHLVARNYDWKKCNAIIVYTHGTSAYASISTCCSDFLGFGNNFKPSGFDGQVKACAAIYAPLDGMNEKGLFVADLMAGDKEETHQIGKAISLTTVSAIRYLLDYAASVDEAIALLENVNMNSSIGSAHHFAICDVYGRSVVVEYVNNKMIVTDTPYLTNHYICSEKSGIGVEENPQSLSRFNYLQQAYDEHQGIFSLEELGKTIQSVAKSKFPFDNESTEWTVVYDQTARTLDFYRQEVYDKKYSGTVNR